MAFKVGNVVVGYTMGVVLACGEITKVIASRRLPALYRVKDMATGERAWLLGSDTLSWKTWGAALTEDTVYRAAFAAYWCKRVKGGRS